jgi:hypothetical protein
MAVATAQGQVIGSKISVDEYGVGYYNGVPLAPGLIMPDPFNGGAPGLAYSLPIPWTFPAAPFADIWLLEPGTTGNQSPSDLLRFELDPTGQRTLLYFYSDASTAGDPADAPADVFGLPPSTPYLVFTETGLFGLPYSEAGPNGFVYYAGPGMPGYEPNAVGAPTEYTFISDVPEPNAGILLLSGLGMLWTIKRQRRVALS